MPWINPLTGRVRGRCEVCGGKRLALVNEWHTGLGYLCFDCERDRKLLQQSALRP